MEFLEREDQMEYLGHSDLLEQEDSLDLADETVAQEEVEFPETEEVSVNVVMTVKMELLAQTVTLE